jgi:phosphatidylinositol alpha-mannosyltransferase
VVIPNGVFVERFASARHRPEWKGTAGRPTIAFLGRMEEPRKGMPVLAAALPHILREIPGVRVLIAGPGNPGSIREKMTAESAAACEFLGSVSDEDKASLLASVDVYVAPNTGGESFGIILIEAMSARATVLASDLPAFARVLRGGDAGEMFRNEDPVDLARAVVALLSNPARREQLAAAGRERANAFDWSVVAEDVMAVYETVIFGASSVRTSTEPDSRWARLLRAGRNNGGT